MPKWFKLFRKPKPKVSPTYVIIYDHPDGQEEYYGYFSSPEEAHRIWSDYTSCGNVTGKPRMFLNVKLCVVVEDWRDDLDQISCIPSPNDA